VRAEADLALGLDAKPVPELVALAHEHASRERLLTRPKGSPLGRIAAESPTRTAFTYGLTSCADPGSRRGLYLRYGFTDTGRVVCDENVSRARARRSSA
jgi:hypothetical protein